MKNKALLRQKAYINGEWVTADQQKTCAVTNPATGETIAEVPDMGKAETKSGPNKHAQLRFWHQKCLGGVFL